MADEQLIGSIDQGTGSSRFLVFSAKTRKVVAMHQIECKLMHPKEGWAEMDPEDMLHTTTKCIEQVCETLTKSGRPLTQIKGIGITNQRETTIVWDKNTGKSLYNAVVWMDARTTDLATQLADKTPSKTVDHFRATCGLPINPYFSALKLRWLIDNVPAVKEAIDKGTALVGTVDTWLIWHLTGGVAHVTDVTNASRYLLYNLNTKQWDKDVCAFFGIPLSILPAVRSSAEVYAPVKQGSLAGTPVCGCLGFGQIKISSDEPWCTAGLQTDGECGKRSCFGDQQAALVGHFCFDEGQAKNTYGTGTFMLYNTGQKPVISTAGLLTTVGFQLGKDAPMFYALEGAGSIGGTSVRWLRDNLGIIKTAADIEPLAASVPDAGACVFVPCFSGLYAPHWQSQARGCITGISGATTAAHIARATLIAVCCQTYEMMQAVRKDANSPLLQLAVDGGMTMNGLLMQEQSNLLGVPVIREEMPEITAFGAAIAAAIGAGIWTVDALKAISSGQDSNTKVFAPKVDEQKREQIMQRWAKAVKHACDV